MKKATHQGTCQCCGSIQKLPNGVLSKHGYTTKWGFFQGVCPGAGHAPLEVSCDMVKESIAKAHTSIEVNEAQAAKFRANTETLWWHARQYVGRTRVLTWVELDPASLEMDEDRIKSFIDPVSKHKEWGSRLGRTLPDAIAKQNETRAKECEYTVKQLQTYIAWQSERLANWKPADLMPL